MLSALLPGVREVRTPLVTGALWAACLWLLAGTRLADNDVAAEFVSRYRLDDAPTTVWFAAAGLTVYLFGSLLVLRGSPLGRLEDRLARRVGSKLARLNSEPKPLRWRYRPLWSVWHRYRYSHRLVGRCIRATDRLMTGAGVRYEAIDSWLYDKFSAHQAAGRTPVMRSFEGGCSAPSGFMAFYATESIRGNPRVHESWAVEDGMRLQFVAEVKREKPAVEARIQMRFPEVYAEIDRLKVEAELRMSIFWPLVLLCVLLAFTLSPLALIGLVGPPLFLRDGFNRERDASEKTWGALVAGEVSSPILDEMAAAQGDECLDFAARYGWMVEAA